jgi:DNA-binding transcriptional regulator YiaG
MNGKKKHSRIAPAHIGDTPAGREIIGALADLHKTLKSGVPLSKRYVVNVREVEVADPDDYHAASVRATRQRLGVSQAVFAKLMGISTILEQSWEQGKRFPDATARRLLDEINREPKRWLRMIRVVKRAA